MASVLVDAEPEQGEVGTQGVVGKHFKHGGCELLGCAH